MRIARPFGRLSTRNLLVFVAGLLAAAFSLALLTTSTAHAAPDASWEGTQIKYEDNLYTRTDDGMANDPRGIPEGANVFYYQDRTVWPHKMHFIYFTENVDVNTAEQAVYSTALFDSTKPEDERYSDISESKVITLAAYNDPDENTTSCNQEGIGWIICPLTNWLAKGMDALYSLISGFLEVRPVQTSTDNALYRVWSVMRNFANVLFMVGFLAIIYSQITSVGLSNYAIKKMLPRLVVAAVLVNISYWICAIAIDASNILGYSIQDIFMNVRENLVGPEGNTWELVNWQSITGAVLAAGAGATALTIGGIAFVASAGSSIFLLLPILVGVLMAVLVALLIMAARQAIITILLVISPLAFVAFLLPNTEKYFEKWRSIGTTMLLLFPIFSVLFGGAQLAGALIIQNADSINLVILGLATQVAPLVITPLLIRFSGSLLGRIAGIVNNPNKGLIDRTRKFAEERAGQMKSRQLAKGNNWLANRARGFDSRRRNREGWQKSNDAMTEANWNNTSKASEIQQYAMEAAQTKELGDARAKTAYEQAKATSPRIQKLDYDVQKAEMKFTEAEATVKANRKQFAAGHIEGMIITPEGLSADSIKAHRQRLANDLKEMAINTRAEERRAQSADGVLSQVYSSRLGADKILRQQAAGIDPGGESKIQAAALSEIIEAKNKNVTAGIELLKNRALRQNKTLKKLTKDMAQEIRDGSTEYDAIEIEAAFDALAQDGQVVDLELARMEPNVDQDMLSRVLARNAGTMKIKGGFHLQEKPELALTDPTTMNQQRLYSLGETSASGMKDLKQGWVEKVASEIDDIIAHGDSGRLQKAYDNVYESLHNPQIRATIGDRKGDLQKIEAALNAAGYSPPEDIQD